jgi:DNA-binding CsgD family transcriptional regulator
MTPAVGLVDAEQLQPVPEGELAALWPRVVSGEWRLVDHYDRQGRRYFIAVRGEAPRRRLSTRERQVCGRIALGQPNKVVAHELGLAVSTVAGHLASAMRKLGVGRRSRLIAAWHALVPPDGGHSSLGPRATP